MTTDNWISVKDALPEIYEVVDTKIDDEYGIRNEAKLYRTGSLWHLKDGSMYVYYTPTHWKPKEKTTKQ